MFTIYHKPTDQYMQYDEDLTNGFYGFCWSPNLDDAYTFKTMDDAIDFWAFTFCPHFRTVHGGKLVHIIGESDIILLCNNSLIEAYDRAMRGI